MAGIDIGILSSKVVQLRYERERAILETYGELLNEGYLKEKSGRSGDSILRYSDQDLVSLIQDLLRESNIATKDVVFSVPASSSFITSMVFPKISKSEIVSAIPYEAKKYIPIPLSEVVLDWDLVDLKENAVEILLVAIPREILIKFKRVSEMTKLRVNALEIESFSLIRSLVRQTSVPTAIVDIGYSSTAVVITDKGKLRASYTFERGSNELTRALGKALSITGSRAEELKREIGLSEQIEEREVTSVISPLVETFLFEIDRLMALHNRKHERKIQRVILAGGGANLKGLVDVTATKFGLEVAKGDPFARIATPEFMRPILREIGPSFAIAVGLALREITVK